MAESLDQRISRFTSIFQEHLQDISQLNGRGNHTNHYRRVLYVTVLDALAKIACPTAANRQRMVDLLKDFSEWKEFDRISLPHLVKLLQFVSEPEFGPLSQYAAKQFQTWISGDVVALERDPPYKDIRACMQSTPNNENGAL